MSYSIKEVFLTLQGEGSRAGTKAVFVRFAGCNLWDGHPDHRTHGKGPCARWCDTDFFKGEKLSVVGLLARMNGLWLAGDARSASSGAGGVRWCVLTGGEPSLQLDTQLVDALHAAGWLVAVETNGTIASDAVLDCDHICLSPKRGTDWHLLGFAHEVKVVLPGDAQGGWTADEMQLLASVSRRQKLFVQAQDDGLMRMGREVSAPMRQCIDWVMANPEWRLSVQTHKILGLP